MNQEIKEQNKIDSRGIKIAKSISKVLTDNLGINVRIIDHIFVNKLIEMINKNFPNKASILTPKELHSEIGRFISEYTIMNNLQSHKSKEQFADNLAIFINELDKKKRYTAFLHIPSIEDFPTGRTFGHIKTISYEEIKFRGEKAFWDFIGKNYPEVKVKEGFWIKCSFESSSSYYIKEDFFKSIQPFLGILSIIVPGIKIESDSLIGIIIGKNRAVYINPMVWKNELYMRSWGRFYNQHNGLLLEIIESILNKKNNRRSKIENKVILSAQISFLGFQSNILETKFLSFISALESLLLNDRNCITLKISEKVSFLLERDLLKRKNLFIKMKKLYKKRSDLIHGNNIIIKDEDVLEIKNIFLSTYYKILDLMANQFNKKNEALNLDSYIDDLKFS